MAKQDNPHNKKGEAQLRDVLQSEPDDKDCEICQNRLYDYIVAQLGGEDYEARFPDVASHLDACENCASVYADAYDRLYELERVEKANILPLPEKLPAPDLSFLTTSKKNKLAKVLRDAVQSTTETFKLQFSAKLMQLVPQPPAAPQVRAPADSERYNEILLRLDPTLAPEELNLPITLTAYRDSYQPDTCLIKLNYKPAEESWPDLGGRNVTLRSVNEKFEALTDPWGDVSFEGIPVNNLADFTLEISRTRQDPAI